MTMGTMIVIMNEGVVNQIGPPMEIYNYPINKFVGGFIGNPPQKGRGSKLD
jgi:multiple sugar transport system ATP-binding protein